MEDIDIKSDKKVVAIIMAGGLGKRMESDLPKVLHKVREIPMINHILLTLKDLGRNIALEKIIVVVGKYKEQIRSVIEKLEGIPSIVYVTQPEPQGTGHAIMCCKEELLKHPQSDVLILSGDVPLLSIRTMQNLLRMNSGARLIVTELYDPTGYGRIVIKDGKFDKIVEQKDCNDEEVQISTVNGGIYCIHSSLLTRYLSYLNNNNKQGEYYLTDIIEIIKTHENVDVDMLNIEKERVYEIIGVNTIQQLVALEEMMDMKEMIIVKNKIE
jgi:UDP-N-acetylglucosamine diphosphorylase/glucosamine-1-phosphate N-acetyltransferase